MVSVRRFIACSSTYGRHGIGLHFAQLVEESRSADELYGYSTPQIRPGDERMTVRIDSPRLSMITRKLIRPSQARFYEMMSARFEKALAESLPTGANTLMVFAGRALESIKRAKQLGYEKIELISPTSHISNAYARHQVGMARSEIFDSWLSEYSRDRVLEEYEQADKIYVHSDYTRDSFLTRGFPAEKLVRTHLVPNPRFVPPRKRIKTAGFQIVYVGRIDSSKGIHVLIDAFRKLDMPDSRLRLVGGWSTRGMKKYILNACEDPRIEAAPGDPLPILHQADVFVHPTFEDGFAYAPVEALCTGVPVIVTEDTGMKEYVVSGDNGYIIPAGDVDVLVETIRKFRDEPLEFDAKKIRKRFYA
ncbi:MAG: glycosyltransferase family 4 protein [Rhodothermales bacterium]|nr:glycosyltransferase family 4 protein [Rhodothermales bacterium]